MNETIRKAVRWVADAVSSVSGWLGDIKSSMQDACRGQDMYTEMHQVPPGFRHGQEVPPKQDKDKP